MNRDSSRAQRGFSLIEAVVSMTIFLFVLVAVLSMYSQTHRLYAHGERTADIQDNGRLAMAEMARQIRMAGYFPENFSATPPSPALDNPLRIATDTALAVYGDADNSGTSQIFLFCVQDGRLRRGIGATALAASYTCANGDVLAEDVTGLRFTYYDEAGDPVPDPPTEPYALDGQNLGAVPSMITTTLRDSIRRVVVTLTVRRAVSPGRYQEYPLASNVWLRNAN